MFGNIIDVNIFAPSAQIQPKFKEKNIEGLQFVSCFGFQNCC